MKDGAGKQNFFHRHTVTAYLNGAKEGKVQVVKKSAQTD
jgi:hypothetical protein